MADVTTVDKAKTGRKLADDLRAVQALPTGIFPETLEPMAKQLEAEGTPDTQKIATDLRAIQAQTGGISPYHLDPVVAEANDMANALVEAAPPAGEAPTNVDAPYAEQQGNQMTCTMGNWTGEPGAYSYQWLSDGVSVGTGTDLNTYTLSAADNDHSFTCMVTATNGFGSANATSNAVVAAGASA
jgi:hypothetical protein